jgi:hypothetical protein
MSASGKDSPEVIAFTVLFARLKEWTDDAPECLEELAKTDTSVHDLCNQLFWAAEPLRMKERNARALFATPVDPRFIAIWRDYEERYENVIQDVWLSWFSLPDPLQGTETVKPVHTTKADLDWENADNAAARQEQGIEGAIDFAQFNADHEERWYDQPDYITDVNNGIAAWCELKQQTGFNLRDVFRRRALIPFVLVPRHVAAKEGSTEVHSLLDNLQQAHDAFVFGSTYAALALMRSIMEAVLRDHYRSDGADLAERIRNVRNKLPRRANEAALHRLRKLANAVLHLDRDADAGLSFMDKARLEKEIVSLLFVLRALIEDAR